MVSLILVLAGLLRAGPVIIPSFLFLRVTWVPRISVSPFAPCPSDARDKRVQRVAHACDTHVAAQAGPGPPGASRGSHLPLFILNRAHHFPRIRICSQSSGAKRRDTAL